jgi:glycosyltransferase involved in cell wall biosynthesis
VMRVPEVSVVIPVYNRSGTIGRALQSVLAQTFCDVEVIVVDDGSSDSTADVVEEVVDSRIRLIALGQNRGAAAARNRGVAAATGDYLAFLDSDDIWSPEKLAAQLAYHREHELGARASCTGYILEHAASASRQRRIPDQSVVNRYRMVDGCEVCPGSTLLIPRTTFLQVGLFDEGLRRLEDWDWLIRYLANFSLAIVPEVLAEIAPSGYGDPHLVSAAAKRMRSLLGPEIRSQFGASVLRRFRSSLAIYTAASLFQSRRYFASSRMLLGATLLSPGRVATWGQGVVRSFAESRALVSTDAVSPGGR